MLLDVSASALVDRVQCSPPDQCILPLSSSRDRVCYLGDNAHQMQMLHHSIHSLLNSFTIVLSSFGAVLGKWQILASAAVCIRQLEAWTSESDTFLFITPITGRFYSMPIAPRESQRYQAIPSDLGLGSGKSGPNPVAGLIVGRGRRLSTDGPCTGLVRSDRSRLRAIYSASGSVGNATRAR
ncbi:hypothetical protein BD309DRAFT_443918 [Dichomitus squalens]|nr:hypothetical protein BD309DRAFT_443918 [Dichomitus squalens]